MESSREAYWRRKLRPMRPGAEPIEAQLSRRFVGSVIISVLTTLIGLMIVAIFAAFGRVDIGLRFFGLTFLPVVLWYWLDYAILRQRTSAYLLESGEARKDQTPPR